ncbi:hypothetical protein CGRA01v4_03950 [Colletotrichum graminicola]|uniref:Uncharacterized protein n=1 Tax=Colletotrichum graminicola (strain M1.001 / M2 / FGSC 10212) TaxID=645133 RepID=E3QTR6_COLGM|nr:uncharacterized protein GLRG_09372 [Colletotrichum graminicola M1.001]EFQ34228.1 hypothetical protein GLRG_09372 [Colletotrichum graminicola M1.001]WDK12670.1 hypothetical protein CGRA01v4_03950 [Colletotrichum graminicola]
MTVSRVLKALTAMSSLNLQRHAQVNTDQNLVLADCGIGSSPENATWSTSRQMNWYKGPVWSTPAETGPANPDLLAQMPYDDGKYPWNFQGASATFPNGETWSAWIEDGTPETHRASKAMSTTDGGTTLWCYTYRGRPLGLSASGNSTCTSAFVCNHLETGPTPWARTPGADVPSDNATIFTNTINNSSATENTLAVKVDVSPRPALWYGTINQFLSSIIFTTGGICSPNPFSNRLNSTVTARCQGTNDTPLNFLPIFFNVLKNLGSLPGPDGYFIHSHGPAPFANDTADDTLTLPTTFNLTAYDMVTGNLKGFIGYEIEWPEQDMGIHCFDCNTTEFDTNYNTAVASAFDVLYPTYSQIVIESKCTFNTLCW